MRWALALCLVLCGCTTPGLTVNCRVFHGRLSDCRAYPADLHVQPEPGQHTRTP